MLNFINKPLLQVSENYTKIFITSEKLIKCVNALLFSLNRLIESIVVGYLSYLYPGHGNTSSFSNIRVITLLLVLTDEDMLVITACWDYTGNIFSTAFSGCCQITSCCIISGAICESPLSVYFVQSNPNIPCNFKDKVVRFKTTVDLWR